MKRKTTEELLAKSFLELARKKRIDKITITDITRTSSILRKGETDKESSTSVYETTNAAGKALWKTALIRH